MRWLALFILIATAALVPACTSSRNWVLSTPHDAAAHGLGPASAAKSVESRPLRVWDLNHASARTILRVLIIGSIHGDEPEALAALPALKAALVEERISIRLIEDLNPDGTIRASRFNARGVDLNRNWPTSNFTPRPRHGDVPLSEPETRFAHDQIIRFRPDAILVIHSARSGPFVNFDGPAERMANAFAAAAKASDPKWHVRASMGYPTPGSLGTWAGVEHQIPILTIELARGHDPLLARRALIDGTRAAIATLAAP